MEKHQDQGDRTETRNEERKELAVDTAEAKGLEVIELAHAPLTDVNFGF